MNRKPTGFGIEGKVALVTGATSGIGRAAALAYAREGARLVMGARRSEEGNALVEEIRQDGGEAMFVSTDVCIESDIERLVATAVERYGRLDIAFNNAGIEGLVAPFDAQTDENFTAIMDTNVRSVFWSMRHQIRAMLVNGEGAIVNNSSMGALIGFRNLAPYIASKHAVMGLTKTAALEYYPRGVRINAVNPGIIDTPLQDRLWGGEQRKREFYESSIGGRAGTPEEVADAVLFLSSPRASFFSGQGLVMDAGYTIN